MGNNGTGSGSSNVDDRTINKGNNITRQCSCCLLLVSYYIKVPAAQYFKQAGRKLNNLRSRPSTILERTLTRIYNTSLPSCIYPAIKSTTMDGLSFWQRIPTRKGQTGRLSIYKFSHPSSYCVVVTVVVGVVIAASASPPLQQQLSQTQSTSCVVKVYTFKGLFFSYCLLTPFIFFLFKNRYSSHERATKWFKKKKKKFYVGKKGCFFFLLLLVM